MLQSEKRHNAERSIQISSTHPCFALRLIQCHAAFVFHSSIVHFLCLSFLQKVGLLHCQAAQSEGVRRPLAPQKFLQFCELRSRLSSSYQCHPSCSEEHPFLSAKSSSLKKNKMFWLFAALIDLQPSTGPHRNNLLFSCTLHGAPLNSSSVHMDWAGENIVNRWQTRPVWAVWQSHRWHTDSSRASPQTLETRANTCIC